MEKNITKLFGDKDIIEKKFDKITFNSLQFDGDNFDPKIIEELKKSTHILISTPPNAEESIIKNFA